ncbi:Pentatricopeptide repeat-containing protein [Heracleum sosnowskyi]|uniref:Pentatricopeptide repeat-containing protein n=1 Tax=Heracleum sosnowskyi TaxID=360622 RepID=A0AAD8J742_9APIA|nr:Pentatricopeptide repeat-containing protein [Heracleum sosnowskyi]
MLSRTIPRISNKTELSSIENICLNVLTFCNSKSLKLGICAHSPIIKLGLEHNLLLNNNLLSIYAKCYGLEHARHLFDEMPQRDVVSWTGMLSAYSKCKNHEEALRLFDLMRINGHYPNEFTLSSVLRSCSSLGRFSLGSQLQSYMIKNGFDTNGILASSLIDLYSKCGLTKEAYELFKNIKNADTLLWTTIISAYIQAQKWKRGLQLYGDMIRDGAVPNEYTFVKLLAASSFLGLYYGKLVHAQVIVWGVKTALVLKTALVDMYCKCEEMDYALKVSKQTHERDVFLWTSIISGFIRKMDFSKAFDAFTEMLCSDIVPTNYTYSGILNACSSILGLELGQQIHARVLMAGLENDVSVGNALVDMYMKCSYTVANALGVFKEISSPNVISWTSLVAGLAEHGFQEESLKAFEEMISVGVQPNSFTLSSILWIFSSVNSRSRTRELHGYIIKKNADQDIVVGNALVDAYAGLGMVNDAQRVIKMMAKRDVITYTGLATRINQIGCHETALSIISDMLDDNIKMDGYSLSTFLSASASLGAMEPGKQLHCASLKSGLDSWISVSNGIVDLYGKCGCTDDAVRAFWEINHPDVASWNCLIFALASNGHISPSLSAFEDMLLAGVRPDAITFLLLLFACSHGGLVDLGLDHFQYMKERHNIEPQLDHYVCKVDLLGRAGRLVEAVGVIESMPFQPNALIYKTLLCGCRLHGNIPLGEDMARRSLELEPSDPTIYVLLANMYEDFGQPELGDKTRRLMKENGLRKTPGQSWMELQNKMHLFSAGDKMHPQINEIHEKLHFVINEIKIMGYPYEANETTMYHSEKLAVIFGLLNAPSNAPIRIIKNIRICKDCHDFMVNLTLLVQREIIVRDGNRFHCFKKGECSCRGFW